MTCQTRISKSALRGVSMISQKKSWSSDIRHCGNIRELDQLLGDILEAKRDAQATKDRNAAANSDKEPRKHLPGNQFILQAVRWKRKATEEQSTTSRDEPSKKQNRDI